MSEPAGQRVLILEDDYFLATDAQAALERSGYSVLGPFPETDEAIDAIEREPVDCAVIDINLGSGPSFEVAHALNARNIPFAFVTGYDRSAIPAEFAAITRLEKPINERILLELVGKLSSGREVTSQG